MSEHKLELLEKGNPEYYSLINEYNEKMKEWGRISCLGLIISVAPILRGALTSVYYNLIGNFP